MDDFTGKVSVVTGAASGIGAETVRQFLAAGSSVVALDRDVSSLRLHEAEWTAADGSPCLTIGVDVTDENEVHAALEKAIAQYGRIDHLVHAAGIIDIERVDAMDHAQWRRVLDVNLFGTYVVCRETSRRMVEAGSGSIVTISTMLSKFGRPGYGAYSASKGGVESFARVLAMEVAGANVRVNVIAPGNITGTAMRDHADALSRSKGFSVAKERVGDVPMQRQGTPEEVASVALFLCSTGASFITGETVNVSGGQVTW